MKISDADVDRVAHTLGGAPSRAYTTPIVYPWAAQHFAPRPLAERPQPPAGPQRLYVHIPFCHYHCTFCFYAVRTGAGLREMERYVAALSRELQWVPEGTPLVRLIVGGGTPTALPPRPPERRPCRDLRAHAGNGGQRAYARRSPDSLSGCAPPRAARSRVGRVSIGIESLDDAVSNTVDGVTVRRRR